LEEFAKHTLQCPLGGNVAFQRRGYAVEAWHHLTCALISLSQCLLRLAYNAAIVTMPIPILDAVPSSETLPAAADVVVIGGGIIGASAALSLAERRVSVVLCEKGMIGAEQSGRNWGWCRKQGR